MNPLPNRLAVYLTAALALLAGLAPLVGNLDWESTAGVVAALGAILAVAIKWLDGWSKYERGEGELVLEGDELDEFDDEYLELEGEPIADGFDEAAAEPIPPAVAEAAHTPEGTRLATGAELEPPPPGPRPDRARRREP